MHIDNIQAGRDAGAYQQHDECIIKLHLHIGTEKTGTTSFQMWLRQHGEQLESCGIIRPEWPNTFLSDINHRMLAVCAQGPHPGEDGQLALGITSADTHARLCEDFRHVFAAEVERRGPGAWIISAEHLHSRLLKPAQVERLAAFLRPYFSDITVHIHLRPQVDLARSIVSTLSRGGGRVLPTSFQLVRPETPYYNYHDLVARWSRSFGAARVRLVPYKRQPSIQRYFLDLWALDSDDFGPELTVNTAEDWRVLALRNAIHPYMGQMPDKAGLESIFQMLPVKEPLHLGLALAQDITARMRPSNEALVKAHPALTMDDLTPDWAGYDHEENLSHIEASCKFSMQTIETMAELQGQLILERARTNVLRAQDALNEGRKIKAYKWLDAASAQMMKIEPTWKDRRAFIRLNRHIAKMVLDKKS